MHFDDRVIFSEDIKKPEKVIEKLKTNKGFSNFYVVAFREGSSKPEIYPTLQFKQKSLSSDGLNVIAIYKSEDEAIELIRLLTEISYSISEDLDYKAAFLKYREENC